MTDEAHIGDVDNLRRLKAQKEKSIRILKGEVDDLDTRIADVEGDQKKTRKKSPPKQK